MTTSLLFLTLAVLGSVAVAVIARVTQHRELRRLQAEQHERVLRHYTHDEGALTVLGALAVLTLLFLCLLAAGVIGQHMRCSRLAGQPQETTYCEGGR